MKENVHTSKSSKSFYFAKGVLSSVMVQTRSVTTEDNEAPRQAAKTPPEWVQHFKNNDLMEAQMTQDIKRELKRQRRLKRQRKREREVLLLKQEEEIELSVPPPPMQRCDAMGL
jgi:hypothetical protein